MIGTLHVGQLKGEIETIEFTGQILRVTATFGKEEVGHMAGSCWITGTDGSVCWRGTKQHDYGVKTTGTAEYGPSTWKVTLDADLYDRTSISIHAEFDRPDQPWNEPDAMRSGPQEQPGEA